MKRRVILAFVLTSLFFPMAHARSAGIVITKADWRGDKQRLILRAKEGRNGLETLTAYYNGSSHTMQYRADRNRYELKLEPVCYADIVTVRSSSGDAVTEPVADKVGMASTALCTSIKVFRAVWIGKKQRLIVRAKEGDGQETLTANYNGSTYTMQYKADKNRYELKLEPICYSDIVTLQSSSGDAVTKLVFDKNGMASSSQCNDQACPDQDGDGYADAACGGSDCNDLDATIHPDAFEICNDGVDQSCSGEPDLACNENPHINLSYSEYPSNCISCHRVEAEEVYGSTHYAWLGETPDMVNQTGALQGKLTNAVNSYCVNILGDWPVCGSCHVGRGKRPDDATADLSNIDCLVCHNSEYAAQRTRLPDGSMGVASPADSMVRNISTPVRTNCLVCHAKAGGGDGVKRGDLALALITNTDPSVDVHMNTSSENLNCQACHVFENHRVIGKGSDLRPTDDLQRGARVDCTTCHQGRDSGSGHATEYINYHVERVACQSCHIPYYAKTATEIHRDWRFHADGSPADGVSGPGHPYTEKASYVIPEYRFWNGKSDNTLLMDDAEETYDAEFQTYPTSRPVGDIADPDSKMYPFKYKTAYQPKTAADNRLIALDTFEYLKSSGDIQAAIQKGLQNMGYASEAPYEWVYTDTYQLLNHGVNPKSEVLQCSECHSNPSRVDLQQEQGYAPKASLSVLCVQCHDNEGARSFEALHQKHVREERVDCSYCHNFSRPERGLRMP
jgi:hypothetical protein